ncbi:septation regulator SpoVG [Treponema pedis]|uniref:Putative septation protein SpoVG n=2 Tax=Treponema pedis TaxID=409322 RepID=S6A048_9SPIR|nr:septation regulator SpoVG [Treponema pedis]AGT44028.1 stage V sporulation protein G [Treponema pedis str. T A4]QOW61868.1 septation regulator SpoVG [Treponema pedis]QSI04756.1 septation regulator SpoVG [Treponema pedis]
MEITEVRVQKIDSGNSLKAYASVTFDNCFVVHNIRIIEGKSGLYVGMPSKKLTSGEFKNIAHPISSEFRDILTKAIFDAYNKGS